MSSSVLEDNAALDTVHASGLLGDLRELPLASLFESPWNPRTYFAQEPLQKLAESIRASGVTTPLIVRPTAHGFEIGAGARRYRAAKLAGRNLVPCIVRALDDEAFLELVTFENDDRQDPHALEQAAGMKKYREVTGCTIEELMQRRGLARSTVYDRLKLATDLIPEVSQACFDEKIKASHAVLLSRLQPKQQQEMLTKLLRAYHLPSERELRRWIQDDVCLEMAKAPFDLSDAQLIPDELKKGRTIEGPGSCTACPKRTINNPDAFPDLQPEVVRAHFLAELQEDNEGEALEKLLKQEHIQDELQDELAKADSCTDPGCFHRKLKAHLVRVESQAREKHPDLIKITAAHRGKADVIGSEQYEIVKAGTSGPNVKAALVVKKDEWSGRALEVGQVVTVRIKPKPKNGQDRQRDWEAERKQREIKAGREAQIRFRILEAIGKKVTELNRADIQAVVLERFGSNDRALEAVCKLHQVAGVRALLERIPKMQGAEFARLVLEAAVFDELVSWHMEEKPEGLIAAASRYKVDAAKIRSEMEAQFKQQDQPAKEVPKAAAPAKPQPAAKKKATPPKKQKISAATRKRIAAQQKKRWAEYRRQQAQKQESAKK